MLLVNITKKDFADVMKMRILKRGDDPGLFRCPTSSQVPCKKEQEVSVREDVTTEAEFEVIWSQATGYGQFVEVGIGKEFISPVDLKDHGTYTKLQGTCTLNDSSEFTAISSK